MLVAIVATIIFISLITTIIVLLKFNSGKMSKDYSGDSVISEKERKNIIKDINRRLAANPKDTGALKTLAELYFDSEEYNKAMRSYQLLIEHGEVFGSIEQGQINLKYGLSAMHCKNWTEAYQALMISRGITPDDYEVNLGLGQIEFHRGNYSRSINFLRTALQYKPLDPNALKYIGQSYFKAKRYGEAIPHLKKALETFGTSPELLYAFARCEYESSHMDSAQSAFTQILNDPEWGPNSALYSGTIYAKKQDWDGAEAAYSIGLKHTNISNELALELRYRLAETHYKLLSIDKALELYKEIYSMNPYYKDTEFRITQCSLLNSNKNLQTYLFASTNDFIQLARKIISSLFPHTKIEINDVNFAKTDYMDFQATITSKRGEEIVLLRFLRTENPVGELFIREFHGQIKEVHSDRGICIGHTSFSVEATRFVEARLIELYGKEELLNILKSIS